MTVMQVSDMARRADIALAERMYWLLRFPDSRLPDDWQAVALNYIERAIADEYHGFLGSASLNRARYHWAMNKVAVLR